MLDLSCDVCAKASKQNAPSTLDSFPLNQSLTYSIVIGGFNRETWPYLLKTKSNTFLVLKEFVEMVERQFNTKVKIIKSIMQKELGSDLVYLI